jgi:hypothetical protein
VLCLVRGNSPATPRIPSVPNNWRWVMGQLVCFSRYCPLLAFALASSLLDRTRAAYLGKDYAGKKEIIY